MNLPTPRHQRWRGAPTAAVLARMRASRCLGPAAAFAALSLACALPASAAHPGPRPAPRPARQCPRAGPRALLRFPRLERNDNHRSLGKGAVSALNSPAATSAG